jgi:branched-chain amino acid transport system substrate-binding protein
MRSGRLWLIAVAMILGITFGTFKSWEVRLPRKSRSAQGNPRLIGVILPLSGDAAQFGTETRNGIDLAVREFNANSPPEGRIQVTFEDSQLSPEKSILAARSLYDRGVRVFIGDISTSSTIAMATSLEGTDATWLSPLASSGQLNEFNGRVFRLVVPDNVVATELANSLYHRFGCRRLFILAGSNSVEPAQAFAQEFERVGGTAQLEFSNQGKDSRIVKDCCYVLLDGDIMLRLSRLQNRFTTRSPLVVTPWVRVDELPPGIDGLLVPWYGETTWSSPEGPAFRAQYKLVFGREPGFAAAYGYDAETIASKAVSRAVGSSLNVRKQLVAVGEINGVTGRFAFRENGEVARSLPMFRRHPDGGLETLWLTVGERLEKSSEHGMDQLETVSGK